MTENDPLLRFVEMEITLFFFLSRQLMLIVDRPLVQVCLAFNPQSTLVATGSMDATARLWDVQSGEQVSTLMVGCSPCLT